MDNVVQDLAQILGCKNIKVTGILVSNATVIQIFVVEPNKVDCIVVDGIVKVRDQKLVVRGLVLKPFPCIQFLN